jgi:DNA-binding NarL/FixJ family response regulator
MKPVRLVIAEGRTLFRQGLAALLRAEADFVVSEAGDAAEARRVCLRVQPDLILLDAALPDGAGHDGLAVTASLRVHCPQAAIVVIGEAEGAAAPAAESREEWERRRALQAGAAAYLRPTVDQAELFRTLRTAAAVRGGDDSLSSLSPAEIAPGDAASPETGADGKPVITERERAVIALLAQGLCNKEIAHRLGISTQTVKNHVSHLLEKLALADRTQLAVYAIEHHFEF